MNGKKAGITSQHDGPDSIIEVEVYPQDPQISISTRSLAKLIPKTNNDVTYAIEDTPPWHTTIILALQHFLTMIGGVISIPLILAYPLCISENQVMKSQLIGTIFFVSGIVTLLQATFGVRLPIIQGGTFSFLAPTFAILGVLGDCPEESTIDDFEVRMREIQGAIIAASFFQILIGFTGIMGFLLKFIGPLAIAPTISLVGLSLFSVAADRAGAHWGISVLTMFLVVLFSQYLKNVDVPGPSYSSDEGCHVGWFPIFKLFPVILAIIISWIFSLILTATDVFPANSTARTDINSEVLKEAAWFRFPYPGQWGAPTFSAASVFGMLSGVLASMVESVGDYYACARLSGAPPPPDHAINRGIGIEGIGCVLAGLFGTGNGTTSYSENIGAIGITKVASRLVIQVAGIIMLIVGVFGKFGALFVTLPDPIVGGVFCVMFGMVTGVGLSNLQFVDMNSSRNIFIIGFSLLMGLAIPYWLNSNPDSIKSGSEEFDQIITVLLSTSMFVGGFFGFLLDNTIPGTEEERGILKWRQALSNDEDEDVNQDNGSATTTTYDLPIFMGFIRKKQFFSYLPFCPTFPAPSCRRSKDDEDEGRRNNNEMDTAM